MITESDFLTGFIYVLLIIFIVLFTITACKWQDEYYHRIAMEQEYDALLERSIILCDELAKAEELVITQNEIIKEKDKQFVNLKRTQCGFCGGHSDTIKQ